MRIEKFYFTFLFFLASAIPFQSQAQNSFALIAAGNATYFPREIFFGDTDEVYITGQCSIRGSINNEITWNGYCYTPLNIFGGCSPALANTFVVGKGGMIRKNGACEIYGSWTDQISGTGDTLFSVKFFDINTGVVVGQGGRTLRTENNGKNWINVAHSNTSTLYNLQFKPDSTLITCGANGTILHSGDKGLTWTSLNTGTTAALYDIDFPSNDTGYAVGAGGVMIRTNDGGLTWNTVSTGVTTLIRALDFVSTTTGVMVGDDGVIKRTTDGGLTWTSFPFSNFYDVFDVKFRNAQVGYFVTMQEAFKTTDGGINWYNSGSVLEAVSYLNDTTIIAVGDNIVRKSTDGGFNWTETHPTPAVHWYDCAFPTPDTGYICGVSSKIMKTTDGGNTFVNQTTNGPTGSSAFFGIQFFDKDHGIAVGSPYMVARTSNGGQTWTTNSLSNPNLYGYYDVCFVNSQVGWICGSQGKIIKSTDGGLTFTTQTTNVTKFIWDLYFLDTQRGFACGEGGTLLRTVDGGQTWTKISTPTTATYFSIAFRDSLNGYIAVDGGYLLSTRNGGANWKLGSNTYTQKDIEFRSKFIGYSVGEYDSRYYFDPLNSFNSYTAFCAGSGGIFSSEIASGITIQPNNTYVVEMDTSGTDFNDAVFLGAFNDTSTTVWYFNTPKTIKAGLHHIRMRGTALSPIQSSMVGLAEVYEDAEAEITVKNDTLFTPYNPKYVYEWRQGFSIIQGATKNYYVPDTAGTYTVYVYFGCCNTATSSISLSFCAGNILAEPHANYNYALICDSSATTLTVSGATSYRWYDTDTSTVVLDTTASFTTPVLTQRDTFYVSAYNGTCESKRIAYYVQFTSKPTPPTASGDSVCAGQTAYLISNYGNQSYWFADSISGAQLQMSAALQIPNLQTTDTFYVSRMNNQCESQRVPVIAYAVEVPIASSISGDTAVTRGDTTAYYYTPALGNSVQWFALGATILSSADSLWVKWDSTTVGKIACIETNALGCATDTIWLGVQVDLALGQKPILLTNEYNLSPNPANTILWIERGKSEESETFYILNAQGKQVMSISIAPGKKRTSVSLAKLSAGNYYVSKALGTNAAQKFVIVH